MLVLTNKPTFFFEITVHRPNDQTGKWDTFTFIGEFKRRSARELEEMVEKGMPNDSEIVASEFIGWKVGGIKQPDGSPLQVNEESRAALLAENGVRSAIVRAWLEASFQGPRKN